MIRIPINERADWKAKAEEFGFKFHTFDGEPYWDETAYYQFTLEQIEQDLEQPTLELHEMCQQVVAKVITDDELMKKFCIPETQWDFIKHSWDNSGPCLYSRIDLAYNGNTPAKFYENNADTPTSLYETGFWQWLWLEENVKAGKIDRRADQFNSLQEKIINRFIELKTLTPDRILHFSCCKDTEEDYGTVQYLNDCAKAAGVHTNFCYIEDIGCDDKGQFTDLDNNVISWAFKLYPWEFMFQEEYGSMLDNAKIKWLEPAWKSIISNKALLPMLWKMFPNHPNVLPAYFEDELSKAVETKLVKKPIFSREGANISIVQNGKIITDTNGPYGEEGFIYQAFHALPTFGDNHTLVGSWIIENKPAGISIREDKHTITQDTSRYLPHIIL